MKVSVVIPAFNEERYIGRCLDSLMRQKIKPDEIIVVDNNSTDKTTDIVKKYPVILINEKKHGITPARNRGFNSARFDIIARTDADTVLPSNWIEKIKKNFQDENLVALSGPAEFYDLPDFVQNTRWQTKPTWLKIIKYYNRIVRKILKHDCLYGPNCIFRKSEWEKIKNKICLNDRQVHEDLDLAIHLAPLGKIKFDNTFVVKTSVRRWKRPENYFEYLIRIFSSIQKHEHLTLASNGKKLIKDIVNRSIFEDFIQKFK